jgi:hypothetical protein
MMPSSRGYERRADAPRPPPPRERPPRGRGRGGRFLGVRLLVGALGVAVALYAAASLTGGWLGEPPWWRGDEPSVRAGVAGRAVADFAFREDRELISALVGFGGVLLLAAALWRPPARRSADA